MSGQRLKDIQKNETNDRRLAHATLASYPWLQRLNCEAAQDVHPDNGRRLAVALLVMQFEIRLRRPPSQKGKGNILPNVHNALWADAGA